MSGGAILDIMFKGVSDRGPRLIKVITRHIGSEKNWDNLLDANFS